MFSLGVPELLIILVIVLLIFGAKRLPEIGKAFGKSIKEIKKATGGDKDEISTWIKDDKEKSTDSSEEKKDSIEQKVDDIPGVKEAKDIKETAGKIKAAGRFFLKK